MIERGVVDSDDMGWSPSDATAAPSQVALATPVTREELTHAKPGGQPSHIF